MHILLPSLKYLEIRDCPEIESFPEGGLPPTLIEISSPIVTNSLPAGWDGVWKISPLFQNWKSEANQKIMLWPLLQSSSAPLFRRLFGLSDAITSNCVESTKMGMLNFDRFVSHNALPFVHYFGETVIERLVGLSDGTEGQHQVSALKDNDDPLYVSILPVKLAGAQNCPGHL
ncbi:hypothetical protein CJ030_MR5G023749 [Morella rubra]|uniref:Uncharacterized protein n=1 Tax=Morella rubra TaxID=262757 RepID=A0A6A1VGZ3_9ROSI|nr:hypothetical protein CJ030_MR5G023749 [Morella rubra]